MSEGKDKGDGKQGLVLVPSYGLLMPQSGNHTENRQNQACKV